MDQYTVIIIFLLLLLIFLVVFTKEPFKPTLPGITASGTVRKDAYEDGSYTYEYIYVLPEANSTFQVVQLNQNFNDEMPKNYYNVYAGTSDSDIVKIGNLTRRGDGYHYLKLSSRNNYTYTCIRFNDITISCKNFS